ncbi:DUF1642 domain-containing protein [Enterococcus faecium]|uniref:DUF1642 domain-containing protein n=1 Tax=Enterococcus faecium TaxID=1352 RepID=UPI003CE587F7
MIQKFVKMSRTAWIEKIENDLSVMKLAPKQFKREISEKEAILSVLNAIELDEPKKSVVPRFVAEYLNYCMENKLTLVEALDLDNVSISSNMAKTVGWLFSNMNQNIFAQAWLFGFEIKKEPLYRVKLGEGYFAEYQGRGVLIIPDNNKEIKIFDSKLDAECTAQTIGGIVEEV